MSSNHYAYGVQQALAWLQTGQPGELNKIFEDARSTERARRSAGDIAMFGALQAIRKALHAAHSKGVRFSAALPTGEQLSYLQARGGDEYAQHAQLLLHTAANLRKAYPKATFSLSSDDSAKNEQPAKSEPLEVRIVEMPTRETESNIERNTATGEIVRATQTSRDA